FLSILNYCITIKIMLGRNPSTCYQISNYYSTKVIRRKNHIREIKSQNRYFSEKLHKFTTTKLLMYLIFINCLMIELYTMWVMFILNDLSALYSLVGAVIGESLAFAVYCYKSFKETKEEQRLQFEKDQFFLENNKEDDFEIINGDDDHSGDIPEGVIMEEDHS
ncbi:MAG: hypothetical protein K2L48_02265, partial [Mycoplasmoidaceae bacterium]|nr:hypothetical protein [Mycoplasmoidaceae bacterium]